MAGDDTSRTFCPGCRETKATNEFGLNRRRPDGLAYYCKACFGEISRASYRRRRAAQGRTVRERPEAPAGQRWCPDCAAFRPLSEFGANVATPTGASAYCRRDLDVSLHVDHDHDHETGAVRGLLCFTCNVGLGNFADDVDRLRRAIAYLGRHPGVESVFEFSTRPWHLAPPV